ncbi:MAG: c-type cytochrome [Pirellulaceae bacterium]
MTRLLSRRCGKFMLARYRLLALCWSYAVVMAVTLPMARVRSDEPATRKNPYTTDKDIRQGRLTVNGVCVRCHGKDGQGGKGPDLTTGRFRHGSTDEALFQNIKNGIRGTGMPGLPIEEEYFIWQIVSYLRSRQSSPDREQPTGNQDRGRQLFAQHHCDNCHWSNGGGGRLGPDLSKWRGTFNFFQRAITHPDEVVDGRYQRVVVVQDDGRVVTGIRLYEDSYYLLLIDAEQNLRSIPRQEIEELALPDQSLMTRLEAELNETSLRDLYAFIVSVAEPPKP